MNEAEATQQVSQRGQRWLAALTDKAAVASGFPASVQVVDAPLAGRSARYIAVVPDSDSPLPRARCGEVGLREGWALAGAVDEVRQADRNSGQKRPLVAVVDVPGQAYGRREEAFGIHQALAGAADAWAQARLDGHPVIALLVGRAMSGAFLAHGYQANRLIALNDGGVEVHAMGKQAAARVTRRSVEGLEQLAEQVAPMAYDIRRYATLGLLWRCLDVASADAPGVDDIERARSSLLEALVDIEAGPRDLSSRFEGENRRASQMVRQRLRQQWRSTRDRHD